MSTAKVKILQKTFDKQVKLAVTTVGIQAISGGLTGTGLHAWPPFNVSTTI